MQCFLSVELQSIRVAVSGSLPEEDRSPRWSCSAPRFQSGLGWVWWLADGGCRQSCSGCRRAHTMPRPRPLPRLLSLLTAVLVLRPAATQFGSEPTNANPFVDSVRQRGVETISWLGQTSLQIFLAGETGCYKLCCTDDRRGGEGE